MMEAGKITIENNGYVLRTFPKTVGSWKMPGAPVYFHTTVKPRWITRFLMRHLLQWEWQDAAALGEKE